MINDPSSPFRCVWQQLKTAELLEGSFIFFNSVWKPNVWWGLFLADLTVYNTKRSKGASIVSYGLKYLNGRVGHGKMGHQI